jgi:signal transduction histidine kinase
MSFHHRKFLRLAGLVLVAVAVTLIFLWDAQKRVEHQEEMMVAQGRAIADIVAESSIHNLGTFNQWERELNRRLVNNALWLAQLDETGTLNVEVLRDFAITMGLFRVLVFDAEGRLEMANHGPPGEGGRQRNLPKEFLGPLLRGEKKSMRLGYRAAAREGQQRFTAGAARKHGGAIVVNIKADELLATRRELGPGHLIMALGKGRGVHYVVIQDETGIQASSTDQVAFPFPVDDPHLQPLLEGAEWVVREFDSALGGVFEVSRVIEMPSGPVLLRVGMDSTLLDDMRTDIRYHMILRMVVLLVSVVLVSVLILAWQRQSVLDREVVKVTAQLRRHEAEARRSEKLVAMGSLAAGVAHQIRNPLNSIHMISQVLEKTPGLPEGVRDQAQHVLAESSRIEVIVQQFLQFAKPREPVFEMTDLAGLVREVVGIQAAAHEDTDINFSSYAPGLDAEVDKLFVVEILENLMNNAAHAIDGKGKVLVSLIARGDVVEIVVADDGPGVAPEDRDRIFDLYYTSRPEGNGLGLSLVAQMASSMGGSLSLDTDPGLDHKGARFVIRLPIKQPHTERKTS